VTAVLKADGTRVAALVAGVPTEHRAAVATITALEQLEALLALLARGHCVHLLSKVYAAWNLHASGIADDTGWLDGYGFTVMGVRLRRTHPGQGRSGECAPRLSSPSGQRDQYGTESV